LAAPDAPVREGEAVSLVCVDEFKLLADIEKLMKRQLEQVVIPGFEPDLSVAPEPLRKVRPPRPPRAQANLPPTAESFREDLTSVLADCRRRPHTL
jgi:hypothetical protein